MSDPFVPARNPAPGQQRGQLRVETDIAQQGSVDREGLSGGLSAFASAFARTGARIGAIADHAAAKEGTEAGRIAGLDPEFRPTGALTIRGEAYDKAGLEIHSTRVQTAFAADLDATYDAHKGDPQALSAALEAKRNAWVNESLPEIRPELELMFEKSRFTYLRQASREQTAQIAAAHKASLETDLAGGLKQGTQHAYAVGLDATADEVLASDRAVYERSLRRGRLDGKPFFTADEIRTKLAKYDEEVTDSRLIGAFDRTEGLEAKAAFIEKFREDFAASKDLGGEYDFDGFERMSRRMETGLREAARAQLSALADAHAGDLISGRVPVDPGSSEDRKIIDAAFAKATLPDGTPIVDAMLDFGGVEPGTGRRVRPEATPAGQAAAVLAVTVRNASYVPEPALSRLRAMAASGDAPQRAYAYQTIANILRQSPGAFEHTEKARSLREDAQLFETFVQDAGLSEDVALMRIAELKTPEFEKRRQALKTEAESLVKEITAGEITDAFDSFWFWNATPELGGSPTRGAVVLDTYRDLVRYHFTRTGDAGIARASAMKDLTRTYNVSRVTGQPRLMKHPPEYHYPAIGNSFDYFSEELKAEVSKRAGKDVDLSDIFLEPVADTDMDIRSGRPPGYGVVWRVERDGVQMLESTPGFVFRAGVKDAMIRLEEGREQRYRERRKSVVARGERASQGPVADPDENMGERLRNFPRRVLQLWDRTLSPARGPGPVTGEPEAGEEPFMRFPLPDLSNMPESGRGERELLTGAYRIFSHFADPHPERLLWLIEHILDPQAVSDSSAPPPVEEAR